MSSPGFKMHTSVAKADEISHFRLARVRLVPFPANFFTQITVLGKVKEIAANASQSSGAGPAPVCLLIPTRVY